MTIRLTSADPAQVARDLDDVGLARTMAELALLLSSAMHERGDEEFAPFRRSHPHAYIRWASADGGYCWLFELFLRITDEWGHRFGTAREGEELAASYVRSLPESRASPSRFPHSAEAGEGPHEYHRRRQQRDWEQTARAPVWTGREPPEWADAP